MKHSTKDHLLKEIEKLNKRIAELEKSVTERKQAKNLLMKSERKYRDLFEKSEDAILIIHNGKFVDCNQATVNMLRYNNKSELLNTHPSELSPEKQADGKSSFTKANEMMKTAFKKGSHRFEWDHKRADGEVFPVEVLLTAISTDEKDQILHTVWRDITDRKQIEEAIIVEQKQLLSIFDSIDEVIYVSDPETYELIYLNEAFKLRWKGNIGDKCYKIIQGRTSPCLFCSNKHIFGKNLGKTYIREFQNIVDKHWYRCIDKAIKWTDGRMVRYEMAIDITESKKAEQALRKYTLELQERNKELDAFSHTVAHDLKNPLGTIMGFAELLFEDYSEFSKDEILNYLNIIIKDSKKTQQIIDNLLLFASVRKAEIKMEELNMRDIVAESINSLTSIIEKSNAEIILSDVLPPSLGYAPWVEEVWTNYLSNAIKYGGTPPRIKIGADTNKAENVPKGMVRFWIRDNGQGISADNRRLLFEKFERINQITTEGHGLGLSIVRRIIKKLGGQVGMESEQGKGSLFYFTLPYTVKAKEK